MHNLFLKIFLDLPGLKLVNLVVEHTKSHEIHHKQFVDIMKKPAKPMNINLLSRQHSTPGRTIEGQIKNFITHYIRQPLHIHIEFEHFLSSTPLIQSITTIE